METVAIGVGNMGGALVRGLVRTGVVAPDDLVVIDADGARAQELADALRCRVGTVGPSAPVGLDGPLPPAALVLVAVKPQGMAAVLGALAPHVRDDTVVMSVAAGVTLAQLRAALPRGHLVRAMPNTPALVGQGASAFALEPDAPAGVERLASTVLSSVGKAWRVDERHMDAVTAVSGSGPAYVFAFVEAIEAAALAVGLPPELAAALARETVVGAARLLEARPDPPATLRAAVTSPGGTTAAALTVLGSLGEGPERPLDTLMARAIEAARARGAELAALAGGGSSE